MEMTTSGILSNMWKTIEDHGIGWDMNWSSWLFDSFLSGIAKFLASVKGDTPQAVVLKDNKDAVVFGALCEKQKNENGDGYTLSYFFDDKELPADTAITSVSDPTLMSIIKAQCLQAHNLFFKTPQTKSNKNYVYEVLVILVNCIKDFFKTHLQIDPNTTLTLENFFTIKGIVTDPSSGKVELSMTPSETLKQIVKEDVSISK